MIVSKWVEVNGAQIEREFFEQNVREARSYEWVEIDISSLSEHSHCIVCGIAIGDGLPGPRRAFQSKGGHICDYCYEHFVESK
jgi:hypothetical protein